MTLKEKFEESINYQLTFGLDGEYNKIKRASSNVETIADSYAIKFAEWLNTLEAKYLIEDLKIIGELNKNPKTKELLEIFKKEKGL